MTVALDKEEVDVPGGGKLWLYVRSFLLLEGWREEGRLMYRGYIVSSSRTKARTSALLRL